MDLGAPILDVAVVVVSTDTSVAGSTSEPTTSSIIQDGVVTAAGYEPITITTTETNINRSQDSFDADVDILTDASTVYQDVIIKKEVNTPSIISEVVEDKKAGKVFGIIIGILLFLAAFVILRYFYLKNMKAKLDAERLAKKR